MITMKEIDALRARHREARGRLRYARCYRTHSVLVLECIDAEITARDAVEAALHQWWAQGCREVEPTPPRISGQSPAEKLADAVRAYFVNSPDGNDPQADDGDEAELRAALAAYDSTRNADPTTSALFGSPPDPILVARYLLDALTGGSLGSLICAVRDDLASWTSMTSGTAAMQATRSNLRANLKALGEKIDG